MCHRQYHPSDHLRAKEQHPGEAAQTALPLVVSFTSPAPAAARPAVAPIAVHLYLYLPRLQFRDNLFQRARQRQQDTPRLQYLVEDILQSLTSSLGVKPQELARVRRRNLHKVEIWRQTRRNADQHTNSPAGKSKLRRYLERLPIEHILYVLSHLRNIHIAGLSQRHTIILLHHQGDTAFHGCHIRPLANKAQLVQGSDQRARIPAYKTQEEFLERLLHIFRQRTDHAEIDKGYHRPFAHRHFFVCLALRQDKDVPWMGIRVEKALVKELVEVGSDGAFRYFKTAHSRRLDSSIVIYLDPVDPL